MPECRHYFHGYSRSKDFLNTLKNCFLTSTCTQRPWTMHYDRSDRQFILKHTNRRGEIDNFSFSDTTTLAGSYGKLKFGFFPMDTYNVHPERADSDVSYGTNAYKEVPLYYTTNEVADLDYLPQYVWYWLWVDDDSFALRVMGNVGGEGTATTASEWMWYGPMKAREDENYIFPDPGFGILSSVLTAIETGSLENTINKIQTFWGSTSMSLATPVSARQFPSLIPAMTTATAPSGKCTWSTPVGVYTEYGYKPFSKRDLTDANDVAHQLWIGNAASGWVGYEFPSPTTITEFTLWCLKKTIGYYYNYGYYSTLNTKTDSVTLMGSNDGVSWTNEGTWDNLFNTGQDVKRFQLNKHITYKYYRWIFTAPASRLPNVASISVGDHTHPSLSEYGYEPLIKSTATVLSKNFVGFNALIDSDSMLRTLRTGIMYNSDIISIEDKFRDYTAHTSADTAAEGQIVALIKRAECPHTLNATSSGTSVQLSWTNPNKFKGIRIIRSTTNHYMTRQTDGLVVFDSVVNNVNQTPEGQGSWTDTGLASGQTYLYAVVSYDSNDNVSTPLLSGRVEVTIP